jgi:hypothetical protein
MSCVKPKEAKTGEDSGGVAECEADRLTAQFANGLHALAQPLTVLRSALAGLKAPNLAEADRQWYLETSSAQVEHAARLFHMLQDLIAARGSESESKPIDLPGLMEGMMEAQAPALEKAGVQWEVFAACPQPQALGDRDKTLEALVSSLETVLSVSLREDRIELLVGEANGLAEVILRNRRAHGNNLTSVMRLKHAVAEAKMQSQNGSLHLTEEPLSIALRLPFYS